MFINIVESDTLSGAHKKGKAEYGSDAFILKCYQDENAVKLVIASNIQSEKSKGLKNNLISDQRMEAKNKPSKISLENFTSSISAESSLASNMLPDYSILENMPEEKEFNLYERRIVCFENNDQRTYFCESLYQKVRNISFIHYSINDQGTAQSQGAKMKFESSNHYVTDTAKDLATYISQQKTTDPIIGTLLFKDLADVNLSLDYPNITLSFAVSSNSTREFPDRNQFNAADEIFITDLDDNTNYFEVGSLFAKTNTAPSLGFYSADNNGKIVVLNKETIVANAKIAANRSESNPTYELKQKLSRLSRSIKAINEHENDSYSQW